MRLPWTLLLTLIAQQHVLASSPTPRSYSTHNYYVIEHDPRISSGASLVDVARALGVEIVEQAGALQDHWLVRAEKSLAGLTSRQENSDPVLNSLEEIRARAALGSNTHISSRSDDAHHARSIVSSVKYLSRQTLRQRIKRAPPSVRPPVETAAEKVALRLGILDPLFPEQWHLVNNEFPEHMTNATPVWDMGFTGKGVISSLVDDGLDYTSDDLAENFVCIYSTYLIVGLNQFPPEC